MAATKVLLYSVLLVLILNWWSYSEGKTVTKEATSDDNGLIIRHKRAVDPLSVIGLVIGVASAIQGVVCTFSEACGGDGVAERLDALGDKLDAIESDVKSIKKDVEDIWEASKRKWYFNHIDYIFNERRTVMHNLKNDDNSEVAKDIQSRFINGVLGGNGKDEYVEKALYHIPGLVTKEHLITHYLRVQRENYHSAAYAAKLTWQFTRKLFLYQEDGYVSMILATALKYKDDQESYDNAMSKICTWWSRVKDPIFKGICDQQRKDPHYQDRRKIQQDYIFGVRGLSVAHVPVQQVKKDCSRQFRDSDGLHFAAGRLFVMQRAAGNILIVDRETFNILATIGLPGSQCGGTCHPFDISINVEKKVMAVAAHSREEGGNSFVMMYKINGELTDPDPSGVTIEHYYTMSDLLTANNEASDVRGVAFCGNRFAYADHNGAIYNWLMNWEDANPVPVLTDRLDWYVSSDFTEKINYFGCSNSGGSWLAEKTLNGRDGNTVGVIPSDTSANDVNDVFAQIAGPTVKKTDLRDIDSSHSRMDILKGIAMDTKRNLFYSAVQWYGDGVSGIYQRTSGGRRRIIREWDHKSDDSDKPDIFDMAAEDNRFLYVVQKDGTHDKCLHKYDHEIDLEDINVA